MCTYLTASSISCRARAARGARRASSSAARGTSALPISLHKQASVSTTRGEGSPDAVCTPLLLPAAPVPLLAAAVLLALAAASVLAAAAELCFTAGKAVLSRAPRLCSKL
jgi:hypothetical protein